MAMSKEKLLEEIRAHVAAKPGDGREILMAVADGLAAYEQAKEKERHNLAVYAVLSLMTTGPLPKADTPLAFLIDAALHQFPSGVTSHASGEVKWWNRFLDVAAKATDSDRQWLANIKGPAYVAWWKSVVEPALEARA